MSEMMLRACFEEATLRPYVVTAPVFLERAGFPLYQDEKAYQLMERVVLPGQRNNVRIAFAEFARTGKHPTFKISMQNPLDAVADKKRPHWEWSFVYPDTKFRPGLLGLRAVFALQHGDIVAKHSRRDRRLCSVWLKYILSLYKTLGAAKDLFVTSAAWITKNPEGPFDNSRRPVSKWLIRTPEVREVVEFDDFCTYAEFLEHVAKGGELKVFDVSKLPSDATYFTREPEHDIRDQARDADSPLSRVKDKLERRYALIDGPLRKVQSAQGELLEITKVVPLNIDAAINTELFNIHDSTAVFRGDAYNDFDAWFKRLQLPFQDAQTVLLGNVASTKVAKVEAMIASVDFTQNRRAFDTYDEATLSAALDSMLRDFPTLAATEKNPGIFPFSPSEIFKDVSMVRSRYPNFNFEPSEWTRLANQAIINFTRIPFVPMKSRVWLEAAKEYVEKKGKIPDTVAGIDLSSAPEPYERQSQKGLPNKEYNFFKNVLKHVRLISAKNLQMLYVFAFTEAYQTINGDTSATDFVEMLNHLPLVDLPTIEQRSGYKIVDTPGNRSWLLYEAITGPGERIRTRLRARRRALYAEAKRWKPVSEPTTSDEYLKPTVQELLEEVIESGEMYHPSDEVALELMQLDDISRAVVPYRDTFATFADFVFEWFKLRDALGYDPVPAATRTAVESVNETMTNVASILKQYADDRDTLQNDALEYKQRLDLIMLDKREREVAAEQEKELTSGEMHDLRENTVKYLRKVGTLYRDDDDDFRTGLYFMPDFTFRVGPLDTASKNLVKTGRAGIVPPPHTRPTDTHDALVAYYRRLFSNFSELPNLSLANYDYLSKVRDVYLTPTDTDYVMGDEGWIPPGGPVPQKVKPFDDYHAFLTWLIFRYDGGREVVVPTGPFALPA